MKKITYSLAISLLLSSFVARSDEQGIITSTQLINANNSTLYFSGGADAQYYRSTIYNSGTNPIQLCNSPKIDYNLAEIKMVPKIAYSNSTFDKGDGFKTLYLFESSIPAYKIVPWYSTHNFNGQDMPSTGQEIRSIHKYPASAWKGLKTNEERKRQNNMDSTGGVRVDNGFYIYKGAERAPDGRSFINPMPSPPNLMDYECYDDKGAIREVIHVTMNEMEIINQVRACVPDTEDDVVKMEPISLADLEAAKSSGSTAGSVSKGFSLKCDPNVRVWFSIVDLTKRGIGNTSYIAKLTDDSTAKGVGYSVSYGSKKLRFGPDVSAAFPEGDTTVDRALIKTTSAHGSNIPVLYSLNFSYAPTGEEISKGTANSVIGITYSYQ
ncbi:hypothetical protein RHO13_12555 [Orbus wheelerorum]|uniref:fimbrial protein n=1 Tax=Orbus wheelerorum TaxID=3074111 RepID=UPI00370DA99C